MIKLTKKNENATIKLNKNVLENIKVTAIWEDNGDDFADNDDLDLRAGILMKNGEVYFLDCDNSGDINFPPYAIHHGDIKEASKDHPGKEVMEINPYISKILKQDIAIVFSVYSAITNGPVSIASLNPKMQVSFGGQSVSCELADVADSKGSYTYVIGHIEISDDLVKIIPGGQSSPKGSESTPWIYRKTNMVHIDFTGPSVFKGSKNRKRSLFSKLFNTKYYKNIS